VGIPAPDRLRIGVLSVPYGVLQEDPQRVGESLHETDFTFPFDDDRPSP
jgi:hypothetical protein